LKLGPGLRHIPPSTVVTTIAGALVTDNKKNAASIEFNSGRVLFLFPSLIPFPTYT
jgi:exosome complex component RRP40